MAFSPHLSYRGSCSGLSPRHRAHSVKNIKAGLSVLPPAALIKGFFSIPGCFQASHSPSLSASDGHAALPRHAPPTNCRRKQQAGEDVPALPTISLCCRFPSKADARGWMLPWEELTPAAGSVALANGSG